MNAELRLALSKGQLCITNGISQWQQFPGEEVLNEIQGSLRAYSLVFTIQVFNSVIATKKKNLTSRFQISLYNKLNTIFQYSEFMSDTSRRSSNTQSSHPHYWQLWVRFTAKPPSECLRIRKMHEAVSASFQKSLLCLQNSEVNNNKNIFISKQIFRSALDINPMHKTTPRGLRLSSEWTHCCDGSVIDQTILNKQARVLQGWTHHRTQSLLLAY